MTNRRRKILGLVGVLILFLAVAGAVGYGSSLPDSVDETDDVAALKKDGGQELVVLIHGMGRTEFSMLSLAWTLERRGFEVLNWGYSSTCCDVEELGAKLADDLRELEGEPPAKIHFVGHSLGNIIARQLLDTEPPEQPGRLVMMAPPNDGAKVADRHVQWAGWLLEPLADLTTDQDSTVRQLSPIEDRDVGVIAGRYDGKVAVEETRDEGVDDHEVVPAAHTFIMNRPDVHHLVVNFLESGDF